MTPQELKNSILQRAIQGKLVEQRAEEGTAEELFQQIQQEKQRLIKEKKIKKEKPLPEIAEEEVPFDIPESWKWVRLRDVSFITGGYAFKSTAYTEKGVRVVRISDFNENGFVDTKVVRHPFDNSLEPYILEEKNILLCMTGGTVGKSLFVKSLPEKMMTNQRVATIKILEAVPEYINFVILSPITQNVIQDSKNSTNDNISMDTINGFFVPLPPLAEQRRIVAKIEELLPLVDRYEKAWGRLEDFNKRFPIDMQKSILQTAIQGKLVEQRAEEGTGEELYQQIQAEKQRLIKEKKIKKGKPLPEITEDEVPFDVPESWKWVRLPSISSSCLGKMLDKQKNSGTPMPYLRNVNVRWNSFDLSDVLEMKFEDITDERFLIRKGDLVICEGGEPGRCAVWDSTDTIHFQKALHRIRFENELEPHFFFYVFRLYANSGYLNTRFTGTTIKHLTGQALEKFLVPLPPLAEQKRIVAKLEEVLPLCERLK